MKTRLVEITQDMLQRIWNEGYSYGARSGKIFNGLEGLIELTELIDSTAQAFKDDHLTTQKGREAMDEIIKKAYEIQVIIEEDQWKD